jgi:DNA-binding transcriptional MerR regulator
MDKSPDAFRTISEVAEDLDLPQHVLRFWETRFTQIKPLKRGGGRRYYRPDDVDLLKGIRHLLYGEGYTIKGVQRILKSEGLRFVQSVGRGEQSVEAPDEEEQAETVEAAPALADEDISRLRGALDELVECDRVLSALRTPADPAE